ncbi:MAG: hypothetical protein ACLFPG_11610 [Desulfohalobiaceae bacterium]
MHKFSEMTLALLLVCIGLFLVPTGFEAEVMTWFQINAAYARLTYF